MWEEFYGYPVEQASEEQLWEEYNRPDDGFVQHALGLEAWVELLCRGLIKHKEENHHE